MVAGDVAVACPGRGDGNGNGCPQQGIGVSVAPLAEGPVRLVVGPLTLRPIGEEGGPCAEQLEVVKLDGAPVDLKGRSITALPLDSASYRKLIGEATGVRDPKVIQLVKVDLEGDGVDEVLFATNSHPDTFPLGERGQSYSHVGVRVVEASGAVKTLLLFEHRATMKGESPMEHLYGKLLGLTDVDGDGRLEVVIEDGYYEGAGQTVFRIEGGRATLLGQTGCGA